MECFFFIVKSLIAGRGIVPIFKETVKIILTLSKDGQFFGATWFLGALFVISILYKVLEAKLPESKTKDAALLIFFGALAFMSIQITLKYMLSRTFVLSAYFAAGAFVKKHEIDKTLLSKEYGWFAAACFIAFAVMGHYNSSNMGKNEYGYPIVFLIGAFLASYAVLYLSKWLDDFTKTEIREEAGKRPLYHSITSILTPIISSVNKLLIFVGKNSIDIVIWHFIAFRIVIVVQMYLNHEAITMSNVLSYYPMYSEAHGWWIIYTIVGLFVPLVWCGILRVGPWGKLFKKMHIV